MILPPKAKRTVIGALKKISHDMPEPVPNGEKMGYACGGIKISRLKDEHYAPRAVRETLCAEPRLASDRTLCFIICYQGIARNFGLIKTGWTLLPKRSWYPKRTWTTIIARG